MNTRGKHSWVKHADFIVLDLLSLCMSFAVAYALRFGDLGFLGSWEWLGLLVLACLVDVAATLLANPYSGVFRRTYYEDAMKAALLAAVGFASMAILLFAFKVGAVYSRAMLGIMYAVYLPLSLALKSARKRRLLGKYEDGIEGGARSLVIVAEPEDIPEVVSTAFTGDFKEFELCCICCTGEVPSCLGIWKIGVIPPKELVNYVLGSDIDDVLVCVQTEVIPRGTFQSLVGNGVTVHYDIERILGLETDVRSVSHIGLRETLAMGSFEFGPEQLVYLAVKRVCDVLVGVVGCVLLLPTALFVKCAFLASGDKAPILYAQERVGMRGRRFKLRKFRTMVPNAGEVLERLLQDPARRTEWEREQKFSDDPRVTRVGRILRKTSIDEFPQFWNILKGEMSLVGPRPLIPGELERHGGLTLYNKVKPGITGWWACNGRSNIGYRERLEMEYHYVRNCSLLLDLTCIARTVNAVVHKEGAR